MKTIVTLIFSLSFCLAKDQFPDHLMEMVNTIKHRYKIESKEDLIKFIPPSSHHQVHSTRDVEDLIGEWYVLHEKNDMFITVDSDQSFPDPMSMIAMTEGNGVVTATTTIPDTEQPSELKYFMVSSEDDQGGDDGDYSYGPRIGAYLTDLDPSSGGVYFDDGDGAATITFVNVPLYEDESSLQTFQIQLMYETGEVVLSFLGLSLSGEETDNAPGGLAIGLADGSGIYTGVDLSVDNEPNENPVEGFSMENQLDLENTKVTFTPDEYWSGYSTSKESVAILPGSYSNEIYVEDDGYAEFELDNEFTFFGWTYNTIYINNDGSVGFGSGDEHCVCWFCDAGDGDCAASYLAGYAEGDEGEGELRDNHTELGSVLNMSFMDFFAAMFGFSLDNITTPTIVTFGSSTDSEDNIDVVEAMVHNGSEWVEFSLVEGSEGSVSINNETYKVEFSEIVLVHEYEDWTLSLDGEIGPGLIELEAGVETELDLLGMMESDSSNERVWMTFNSDGTGQEVYISEEYYGEVEETEDFSWTSHGSDSLTLFHVYEDEYGYTQYDTMGIYYYFIDSEGPLVPFDTLVGWNESNPCEDFETADGIDYDMCFEDEGFSEILGGLEDISSFKIKGARYMIPAEYVAVDLVNDKLPSVYKLHSAYPNPFNPVTTIRFDVGATESKNTSLKIYDIKGKLVATLLDKNMHQGFYEVKWNASEMASGVYFSELRSGDMRITGKLILMK